MIEEEMSQALDCIRDEQLKPVMRDDLLAEVQDKLNLITPCHATSMLHAPALRRREPRRTG